MSLSTVQTSAIREILEQALSKVSPSEVILIDDISDSKSSDHKFDGMLGYGGGPEVLLVIPILWEILKELASSTAAELAKDWGSDLAGWVRGHTGKAPNASAFQKFASILKARLEKRGFTAEKAAEVSDCVVAILASRADLLAGLSSHR